MSLEQIRKENKKELAQRDEELEEVRCNAHKKVKGGPALQRLWQNLWFEMFYYFYTNYRSPTSPLVPADLSPTLIPPLYNLTIPNQPLSSYCPSFLAWQSSTAHN